MKNKKGNDESHSIHSIPQQQLKEQRKCAPDVINSIFKASLRNGTTSVTVAGMGGLNVVGSERVLSNIRYRQQSQYNEKVLSYSPGVLYEGRTDRLRFLK